MRLQYGKQTAQCSIWRSLRDLASEAISFSGSDVSEADGPLVREFPAWESKYWS